MDRPSPWQHCVWRARDAVVLAVEGEEASPSDPPIAMAKTATLAQIIVREHHEALERRANG
jgi:hypothetical protein